MTSVARKFAPCRPRCRSRDPFLNTQGTAKIRSCMSAAGVRTATSQARSGGTGARCFSRRPSRAARVQSRLLPLHRIQSSAAPGMDLRHPKNLTHYTSLSHERPTRGRTSADRARGSAQTVVATEASCFCASGAGLEPVSSVGREPECSGLGLSCGTEAFPLLPSSPGPLAAALLRPLLVASEGLELLGVLSESHSLAAVLVLAIGHLAAACKSGAKSSAHAGTRMQATGRGPPPTPRAQAQSFPLSASDWLSSKDCKDCKDRSTCGKGRASEWQCMSTPCKGRGEGPG